MLARLDDAARARHLPVRALHATAEATTLDARSLDLVVVADALHFLDAQLVAEEIARVLRRGGALAVVTAALADTPYMRAVGAVIDEAVPRRPRALERQLVQVSATTEVPFADERVFHDEVPVDPDTLERILRSISFIGPAMHASRFAAFRARVHALPGPAVWARTFTLRAGRRVLRRESPAPTVRFGSNHVDRKRDLGAGRVRAELLVEGHEARHAPRRDDVERVREVEAQAVSVERREDGRGVLDRHGR